MGKFQVGYAKINITPDYPVPLASYGTAKFRFHDRVLNEIYFTAVAVTDETDRTMLLCTYDITQCPAWIRDPIAERVEKELGVENDYFHLSGTHTHSSVELAFDSDEIRCYREDLKNKAVEACRRALSERREAEILVGETKTEGMNFVRHYVREDGVVASDNHGGGSKAPLVRHVKAADETMRVVKFTRKNADGTPARDVVLVNWQAHNHLTGGFYRKDLAADFSGAMRSYLESERDCYAVFLQGCAGNLNEKSRLPEENKTTNYLDYGKMLASYVLALYDNMTPVPAGRVVCLKEIFRARVNRADMDKLDRALEIQAYRAAHGIDDVCKKMVKDYGFASPFHADGVIKRSKITGDFIEIPLRVHRIGEIAFSACPFEMFDTTGEEIRAGSPFAFTVTQGYTDAQFYYLPTAESYDYGCYEADTTRYARGTAEEVRDQTLSMLRRLKEL